MSSFQLDPRLDSDSVYIGRYTLCQVRLINDSRWPWLILVPEIAGAEEIHDLPQGEQAQLAVETSLAAAALKNYTSCTKINTAAIGNIVRQLHIHVIARNENDTNWPGPVWGYGEREEYGGADLEEIVRRLQGALASDGLFQELC